MATQWKNHEEEYFKVPKPCYFSIELCMKAVCGDGFF
jgi:hypothetical protein